ncbi:hypothetical protein D3C81_903940 [compost metagenome]
MVGDGGDLAQRFDGEEALVARHQHVREGHQALEDVIVDDVGRTVLEEQIAFLLVDVDGERTELARLQRFDDGARVDQAAARGIHQHGALLHQRQGFFTDHVARAVHQRAMQRDDVGLGQQLRQFHHGAQLGERRRRIRVVAQHGAAETLENARRRQADLARADNAHRHAMQGGTEQAVQREIAFAHARIGAVRVAVQGLHQGQRVFGHGFRRVRRHAGDKKAQAFRCFQVQVVVAGAAQQDGAHAIAVQGLQHGRVKHIVDEDANGFGALRQHHGFLAQQGAVVHQFDAACFGLGRQGFVEEAAVVGLAGEEGDFHGASCQVNRRKTMPESKTSS